MFKTTRDLQNVERCSPNFSKTHCKLGQREIYLQPLKQNRSSSRASTQALFHWWHLQLKTGSWDIPNQALLYPASTNHVPHKDEANMAITCE